MLKHTDKAVSSTKLEVATLLAPKYNCPTAPFNDSIREDLPTSIVKVLHNVPCAKETNSKQLPSMTVTFHQKKGGLPSEDGCEFEVESTHAQWEDDADQECLCHQAVDMMSEVDSVFSDLGTDGSLCSGQTSPSGDLENAREEKEEACTLDKACPTHQLDFDHSELDHFMNVTLSSLASIEKDSVCSGTPHYDYEASDADFCSGAYSLSFTKAFVDAQNTTLPHAIETNAFALQPDHEIATMHEIQIEEQGGAHSKGPDDLQLLNCDSEMPIIFEPASWEELKKPLVDLLLKFYNGEDTGSDFVQALRNVLEVLTKWRLQGIINTQSLLNFTIDQVLAVVTEVKQKLVFKAIDKYDLLSSHMRSETDGAPTAPTEVPPLSSSETPAEPIHANYPQYIKEYPECPLAFDQMVVSITQYFELINLTSYKLEDLWLNLLDVLCLDRPNKYTVFKAVHHQGFRNIILKDPLMQQIIREVDSYKESGYCHMNPAKHLEKIYDIRRNCSFSEESYRTLFEQGVQSEALSQLIEVLHDEVSAELRLGHRNHQEQLQLQDQTFDLEDEQELYGMIHKESNAEH